MQKYGGQHHPPPSAQAQDLDWITGKEHDLMPYFTNGSGWGKLEDTVQLEAGNSMVVSVSLQTC